MTEPKTLSYDEQKAAEAAFRGYPPDAAWTEAARMVYDQLTVAVAQRRQTLQLSTERASFTATYR